MGTGAVGAYYGACLLRGGRDVTFVARGANLEALRSNGLRVTGAMGDFGFERVNAVEASETGSADVVLLCVKNYDLEDAARSVSGAGEIFLTLQNGVDAPLVAREVLGDVVVAGSTGIVADYPEPGHVHCVSSYAWMRFGEMDGGGISKRVELVNECLSVDGVEPIPVPDARVALWEKMSLMCGMAGLTTLLQRPMGEILGDAELRERFETIVRECESVARAKGVPLSKDFVTDRMGYADRIDPGAMSSMSRDLMRGKRIELETFNGAIVRMGAELGVDVPANAAVYEGISAKSA
jgi:2-dehydropantoate 2-reductase